MKQRIQLDLDDNENLLNMNKRTKIYSSFFMKGINFQISYLIFF